MSRLDEVICHCQEVTYAQILEAIHNGAKTVDDLGDILEAGIACGGCIDDLEEILEEELTK